MTGKSDKTSYILIVEDNIGDVMLLTHMLQETVFKDYDITYVPNLEEVENFKKSKFSVIILDLHLSDKSPLQTFEYVNKCFARTPIIVLTGLQDDGLAAKIVRMGAQDYLIKGTFDAQTLQKSIRYAVERKKSQIKIALEKSRTRSYQSKADRLETESHRLSELNQAKDVFLSIASHQLRTPATVVKQQLGMILEGYVGARLNPELEKVIRTAYESNERQLRIVDDMLSIARLEAGKVTLKMQPTNIDELIRKVIADQQKSIEFRGQKVVYTVGIKDELPNIDTDNIRMVFDNILDNASKYSPEKSEIKIKLTRTKSKVCIEFKDQGVGIAEKDKNKLFDKFSRLDESFTHAPNGSGLGLYWAKEIIRLHRGNIKVKSELGKGSSFRIELPA